MPKHGIPKGHSVWKLWGNHIQIFYELRPSKEAGNVCVLRERADSGSADS